MSTSAMLRRKTTAGMVYERRGSGRTVVLVHGWSLSGRLWMYEEALLADRHDVIVPDLPGLGRSDAMPGPYGVATHADALLALLDEAGVEGAVLVGFAYGAAVSLTAAAKDASRVAGVASVGIPGPSHLPIDRMLASMQRDWPGYARRSAEALCEGQSEATTRWLESLFLANRLPVAAETWADIASFDPRPLVAQIDRPLLFIHGSEDTFAPIGMAHECVNAAKDGRVAIAADTQHLVPMEQQSWLHETLTEYLEEIYR